VLRALTGEAAAGRADLDAGVRAAHPTSGYPPAARAGLALVRGDLAAAQADLDESLRRDPAYGYALLLRAILRARQGDVAGSGADAAAARARRPAIDADIEAAFGLRLDPP
jgi:hypothetical protein